MNEYEWDNRLEYLRNTRDLYYNDDFIGRLINRGLTYNEAIKQYEAELRFSKEFAVESSFIYAPSMKITFGIVKNK